MRNAEEMPMADLEETHPPVMITVRTMPVEQSPEGKGKGSAPKVKNPQRRAEIKPTGA